MGVKSELGPGGVAGMWETYFVCDTCGEKIEGFGDGMAVFLSEGDRRSRTGEFLTVHKGRERGCDSEATRGYDWQDLDQFIYELFTNAGFDWDETQERRAGPATSA